MTNPNDQAYPGVMKFDGPYVPPSPEPGLTKREYFAAMAMLQEFTDVRDCHPTLLAKLAVETADALIAELNKA